MRYLSILIMALAMVPQSFGATTFPASTNQNNTFFKTNTFLTDVHLNGTTLIGTVGGITNSEPYSGIGVGVTGSPRMFFGGNTPTGDDSAICIGRNVSGTNLFSHAIRDEGTFNSETDGAYTSFDAAYYVTGSTPYNHANAFQSRQTFYGTGGINEIMGFTFQPSIQAPASTLTGLHVYAPAGTNYVTNFYGIKVDTLSSRSNINGSVYSFYSAGPNVDLFNTGRIATSSNVVAAAVQTTGNIASSGGNISANQYFISGGYILASASGLYNGNASKVSLAAGTATAGGAIPWVMLSGNGSVYSNGYLSFKADGVEQMNISNSIVRVSGNLTASNGLYYFISQTNSGVYTNVWQPSHSFGALSMYTTNTINGGANTYATITNYTTANSNLMGCSLTGGIISPSISGFYRVGIHLSGVAADNSARVEGDLLLNGVEKDEVSFVTTFDNPPRLKGMSAIGIIYITNNTPITFQVKSSGANGIEIVRAQMTVGAP